MKINVSVPGSVMLMGEHAVLFGQPALACAVDKYIHIELEPSQDGLVSIESALAEYTSSLKELKSDPRLSFVLQAIRNVAQELPSGFKLTIRSEFSHTVGLGSSAAVTAGVVAALAAFSGVPTDADSLFEQSLKVVHQVQDGRGSGSDLVASIYGGIVYYVVQPREVRKITAAPEIDLFYAGYKTKTPDVLRHVEHLTNTSPEIYSELYQLMGAVTRQAESAIKSSDWERFGTLMNTYQGLLDALGVSDHAISDIVYRLRESPEVKGCKISGSGLGDCVISLGIGEVDLPYERIPVAISEQGIRIHAD